MIRLFYPNSLVKCALAGACLFFASHASADVLANYTFTGSSLASFDANINSVASSIMGVTNNGGSALGISSVTVNAGSTAAAAPTYYILNNATPTSSAGANDYLQFTLTINEGFTAALTKISFDHAATHGTAFTSNWDVRYSLDGFATAGVVLGTSTKASTTGHDYVAFSQGISAPALQSIGATATVTFRIYAFDSSDANGANRIDNITVEGTVAAVPEPATYAAILGLAGVGLVVARRRARLD